jgi:divalent metal cation (Fe/Co/Zn/Cd) transporter
MVMCLSLREVSHRFRIGFEAVRIAFIVSVTGLALELTFAILFHSMILLTDAVHWAVDGALEFTTMMTLYLVIKVLKRFSWGVLYLESVLALIISIAVLGTYMVPFVDYINSFIAEPGTSITTANPFLALASLVGGALTFYTFTELRKAYIRTRLEILKAEYVHAIIDTVASALVTIGIIVTSFTQSKSAELLTVIASLFFTFHSITNIAEDSIKSVLGLNIDVELKYKLMSVLSERFAENMRIRSVDVRKIGSFYIAKAELYVHPHVTISKLHKMRLAIIRACREVNEMIYHVDVMFYPDTKYGKGTNLVRGKSIKVT